MQKAEGTAHEARRIPLFAMAKLVSQAPDQGVNTPIPLADIMRIKSMTVSSIRPMFAQGFMPKGLMIATLMLVSLLAGPMANAQDVSQTGLMTYPGKEAAKLDAYKGKVMLVNFWAPWCVPCLKEFPSFQKMVDANKAKGLVVVAVTAEKDEKMIKKFLSHAKVEFPIYTDPDGKLHSMMGIKTMPTTVLVDKTGKVVKMYNGYDSNVGLAEMEKDALALAAK